MKSTTALRKITALRRKIRIVQGGQGAGKTIAILMLIANHASSTPNREIIIASEELTKMRLTVIKDFIKVMKGFGVWSDRNFINGTLYRFPNGSFIKFIGLDKADIGKGLRCHVIYFNELNKIGWETYREAASRADAVYADFNPNADFYAHTELIPRDDCDFIKLTFKDNEYLGEGEREEIMRYYTSGYDEKGDVKNKYWANLWKVYGLGEVGSLQGVVFENWDTVEEMPAGAKLIGTGLDWGYNDPTAIVQIWESDGVRYWDEVLYKSGMVNSQIAEHIKAEKIQGQIWADSAEPKSIEELRREGIRIAATDKGKDSIMFGIDKIQRQKFYVTARSTNLIYELRNYVWATDKTGKSLNKPVDANNHAIDGPRYVYTMHGKYSGSYSFSSG